MWNIIVVAGWPIWPLIATSIFGVAIILERLWTLRESNIAPSNLWMAASRLMSSNVVNKESIEALKKSSPLGEIMAVAIENKNASLAVIKDSIEEAGSLASFRLEKYLGFLSTISTVAPLLGLFGTIIGMVELFSSFTSTGHDVSIFARGISIALYNTAGGIVVAVPAMIAFRYFRSKVDYLVNEMEQQALRLVEVIRGERK
ncbi:MotA/TolQ/ExbB proton channel family protein [Methylophilaceae bacterium]|nr:MotA/TolQ/ExbB proton channel family protein [Methylophilaceae bacterium]